MSNLPRERVVSSETVFAGKLISARVDRVELPGGRRAEREIVMHPGSVAIVPLLPNGRVVLIRQYRHAAGQELWELPAGTMDAGETPEACARRELVEEIGYEAGEMRLLFSAYLSPGYLNEIMHVFLATGLRPVSAAPQEDEGIEPVEMELAEAVRLVARGEVQNMTAVGGLLAAARLVGPGGSPGV